MGKKVSASVQIKKKIDLDDLEGDLRMALKSSGEIKEFRRVTDHRYEVIASPDSGFHGVKGEVEITQPKEDRTMIDISGKIVRTRWGTIWMHVILMLLFFPWIIVAVILLVKSEKAVKRYVSDVANHLQFNLK